MKPSRLREHRFRSIADESFGFCISMNHNILDKIICPLARRLHANHKRTLGIRNTMSLAGSYNKLRYRRQDKWRRTLYRDHYESLLTENGPATRPEIELKDGWALDSTLSLPHLDRVLEDSDKIIAERAGHRLSAEGAYRSFFQDMWTPADLVKYPSFLDFATSTDVLAIVGRYLQSVPALSTTMPSGIRIVESNAAFDDHPDAPHDSQLYHMDYYSLPNVYMLVLLRDTTKENGPWTFLPRGVSSRVCKALGNWKYSTPYRFTDEQVYSVAKREDAIEFTYPRGTVLFIESSGCLHYGSRNCVQPRFQLMIGYTGACRTDFTEVFMTQKEYPIRESDSRLRKMVLDKSMIG